MQNEVTVSESQMLVIAQLATVAARVTGVELQRITLGEGEGDEGEHGDRRVFLLEEQCVGRSMVEVSLAGEVRLSRGPGRRWDTGVLRGSVHANPDHPIRFKVEKGIVETE